MAKRSFQGQNDAPAPPQNFNKHVHDESRGPKPSLKPVAQTRPIDTNNHTDSSEFARRHKARIKANENFTENQLEQAGEDHGEDFKSGINAAQKP